MLHMKNKRIKKQAALLYFVVFLSFFAPSFVSHGDSSWPGKSATIPRQQLSGNKKLRLAVPQKFGRSWHDSSQRQQQHVDFPEAPDYTDFWLSSAAFFVLTGFVIWLIERPINDEFQASMSQQIGIIFWFSVSALVFAHKEKLRSNLSRFVVIVWMLVVLILTSSYTATLTSMITVQHIQLNSEENYIGYQIGSLITNTEGVISNLNFKNTNLKRFLSPEDYANALSRGSKNGGVSAIIDEIPYIKILLSSYSADYSMQAALLYFAVVFLSFFAPSFASHGDTSWANKKLRLAVPQSRFSELVNINRDLRTNTTTISGFCIDVFKAAIEELDYQVDYEFIPFVNATGQRNGTYSELIDQIFFQNYDGAVGDVTITANRSLYVDFTLLYTDLGVGMITPKGSNNMWIFLKPLTTDLWLSSAAFFVLTGFVIWLIERPINQEFQGSMSQQIGIILWFSFSTIVFAHQETLRSNLSRFVVIVWVFVVFILTSSYTATLTSMITVQHIQLNSKENYLGYRSENSLITNTNGVISNLNFKNTNLKSFISTDDYANALSRGIKNGGVSAIIDEIPYIKIFLSKYSADYSMVKSIPGTNGFAFICQGQLQN
ncbi:hypothetical protein Ddye_000235 [Dipteronia dyeriana]|uniref:Ionotropic glutamate receptor C-terminal domain-containing protein n=1 Tax=Dipteronia dyeriana TaxID=168575 RepID=A0AAE0CSC8_9ROSI|nr:hypothetical protein Ddye_000235 [Dipteronia dyeriana]